MAGLGEKFGLFLCLGALFACGAKTWSSRSVSVPIRTLAVDEAQLFQDDAACVSTLRVSVRGGCPKPVDVLVQGTTVATLARPAKPEVAPLPKDVRPTYSKPGKDESRLHVDVALPKDGAEITLAGAGKARFGKRNSAELVGDASVLAVTPELAGRCQSFNVEVECK